MSPNDLKIYGLNSVSMALSFTEIEQGFKIILLCVSIVYTIMKIIELIKKKKNDNKTDNS
jgi:hypothetical protein